MGKSTLHASTPKSELPKEEAQEQTEGASGRSAPRPAAEDDARDEHVLTTVDPPPRIAPPAQAAQRTAHAEAAAPPAADAPAAQDASTLQPSGASTPGVEHSPVSSPSQQPEAAAATGSDAETASADDDPQPPPVSWGFGALGSRLQQAALGAVKDIKVLSETLQQAVAEVTADPVTEVDQLASYQAPGSADEADAAAARKGRGAPTQPAPEVVASRRALGEATPEALTSEEEAHRAEVLQRLAGTPDRQFEAGLKAFDDSVEQIATGAVKALGSLWGSLASSVSKVEAATVGIAGRLVDTLERPDAIAPALEAARGTLQKRLQSLLDPIARGIRTLEEGEDVGEVSLEHELYLFGGSASLDELEALCSQCSHIVNRARAALSAEHGARLDAALHELGPHFDWQHTPAATPEQGAAWEDLEGMHLPLAALVRRAKTKAAQLAASAPTMPSSGAAGDGGAAEQRSEGAGSEQVGEIMVEEQVESLGGGKGDAALERAAANAEAAAQLQEWLRHVQASCVKVLAEAASGQLDVLLTCARSISAPARFGKPLPGSVEWPPSGPETAALLRHQAALMLGDLEVMAGAFKGLLPPLAATADGAALDAVQELGGALDGSCEAAASRVRDGFRSLLYVVLLASVHRQGLADSPRGTSPPPVTGEVPPAPASPPMGSPAAAEPPPAGAAAAASAEPPTVAAGVAQEAATAGAPSDEGGEGAPLLDASATRPSRE